MPALQGGSWSSKATSSHTALARICEHLQGGRNGMDIWTSGCLKRFPSAVVTGSGMVMMQMQAEVYACWCAGRTRHAVDMMRIDIFRSPLNVVTRDAHRPSSVASFHFKHAMTREEMHTREGWCPTIVAQAQRGGPGAVGRCKWGIRRRERCYVCLMKSLCSVEAKGGQDNPAHEHGKLCSAMLVSARCGRWMGSTSRKTMRLRLGRSLSPTAHIRCAARLPL